jgi:arylsulfatase A-like enzyme
VDRVNVTGLAADQIAAQVGGYEAAFAFLDEQIGRLLAELDRRGVLENTLVVLTSDHGEELGEHNGVVGHYPHLYETVTRVPLIFALPGRIQAVRVAQPVTLADVPATILDVVGADAPAFPGVSLRPYWDTTMAARAPGLVLSEITRLGRQRSIVVGRHHIIRRELPQQRVEYEVYDVERDPFETNDLAATEEGLRLIGQHEELLDRKLGAAELKKLQRERLGHADGR